MNTNNILLGVAILGVLGSAAGGAQAAQAAQDEEVLVLGTRIEESIPMDLQQYGNRLEVISGETIRAGGFNDVTQALQMLVPGLYVAPKNGAFDYVQASLQGSRNNEILWLIDGIRISNRLYNNTSPLDTIPAHMIERVEVLKGGQGIFYGTQSVSGVVNVVTRGFTAETDARVGIGFDDNDGKHADGFIRGSLGDTRVVLYGSYDDADGFEPYRRERFDPGVTDRERGYEVKTVGAKLANQITEALTFSLNFQYSNADLDFWTPFNVVKDRNDRDEKLLSGKLDYALSDQVGFYLKAYYHDWDTMYHYGDGSSSPEFWGYQDSGFNLMTKLSLTKGFDYFVGFDRQSYEGEDEVWEIAPQSETVNAVFAQVRTTPDLLANTQIALGARYNEPSEGPEATVWNLSGRHDFNDSFYVRATGGTAFRLPDAYQLYSAEPGEPLGNPDLKPERSQNVEIGVGGRAMVAAGLSWELIGFKRDVEDLIVEDYDINLIVNTEGEVNVEGAEAILSVGLNPDWALNLDHTYARARQTGSDLQIRRIPENLTKVGVDYRPDRQYGGALSVVYIGNVYETGTGVGRREYGNYAVADLSAFLYVDAARRQRLGLRLENAFDEEYATSLVTPSATETLGTPRTVHLTYSYNFGAGSR